MEYIDLNVQTLYADLLRICATPCFDGKGLSFTKKTIKGHAYWYLNVKLGQVHVQKYIGADNKASNDLMNKEREKWEAGKDDRLLRAKYVDMSLRGGMLSIKGQEGKILKLLERAGVFLGGGLIIGTLAFRLLGNNLGVIWSSQQQTQDLDIAADYRLNVALPGGKIDLGKIILDANMGFIEVPALNRKHPSTTFTTGKKKFSIDIVTPEIGKPKSGPVFLNSFNTYGHPLRYLDYLFIDQEPVVGLYDIGILLNVPNAGRFAIHKLVISQRRQSINKIKIQKDIMQASQLLDVLFEQRPGEVIQAYEAASIMGDKFVKQLHQALKLTPDSLQQKWRTWIDS